MNWLQKLVSPRARTSTAGKGKVPEGLWEKCDGCSAVLYRPELEASLMVCPKCGHHHAIGARVRLAAFLDPGSAVELFAGLEPIDPLKFRDSKKYKDKIVTEVIPFIKFYPAQDYHQEYIFNHPDNPYVKNVSIPDFEEFKKNFKGNFKP